MAYYAPQEFDSISMLDSILTYPREHSAERGTRRSPGSRKKWTFTRTTRGSNFHDEEEFPAQSGVKQGSLERLGSGFVSTGSPPVRLTESPRGKPFSMTIEFRCAKIRREVEAEKSIPKPEENPGETSSPPDLRYAFEGPKIPR